MITELQRLRDKLNEQPNMNKVLWHLDQALGILQSDAEVFRYLVYLPDNTTLTVEHHRKLARPRGFVYQFGGGVWTCKGVGETTTGPEGTIETKAELIHE